MTLLTARKESDGLKFALPLESLEIEVVFKPHSTHKFHIMARNLHSAWWGNERLLRVCDTADEVTQVIDEIEHAKQHHIDVDISV